MPYFVEKKVVVSGDIVEIYEYEKGYGKGYEPNNPDGRGSEASVEDKEENRDKVLSRSRKALRNLVNANVGQYGDQFTAKFLTLTFADSVTDIETANYEFKKFIKRMNYEFYGKNGANMRYVVVPEIQKKREEKYGEAVWHYHVILFNIPYTKADKIAKIWGNGFIKINRIDRVDNVGAYMCKYMTKDNTDLVSKKSYFSSRNLFKPDEITDKKIVENVQNSLQAFEPKYESTFQNEHRGIIRYKQYNIRRLKNEENSA